MRVCPQCGTQVPDAAGFCGQCGTTMPRAAADAGGVEASAEPAERVRAQTVIGHASPSEPPPAPTPAPAGVAQPDASAPAAPAEPAHPARFKTMLGGVGPAIPEAPPSAAPATAKAGGTIFGMPAVDLPLPPQPALDAPVQNSTMLGVAMPGIAPTNPNPHAGGTAPMPARPMQHPGAPPPVAPTDPMHAPIRAGTQLGIGVGVGAGSPMAMPAAAAAPPMHGAQGAPPPGAYGAPAPAGALPVQHEQRTMLGVAAPAALGSQPQIPPAAPSSDRIDLGRTRRTKDAPGGGGHAPMAALPPIVPAPPPLVDDEPLPRLPPKASRRGLPLALAAGGVAVLVLIAGVVALFVVRGGPPLIVQPRLGAQGNEMLHLVCEGCNDGTVADLGGKRATFKDRQADLELSSPLAVGDNPIEIKLERPGVGRNETVKAVVPIAYRVRADLADLGAAAPQITVRVEALPQSKVLVDGQPVDLDAHGKGAHAIDLHAETDGPSDEGKVVEKTIPYEVTPPKGARAERGTVIVRFGVIPLHVDAPGATLVTDQPKTWVAGRTAKGASVTVAGAAVEASTGVFATLVDTPAPGAEATVDVRSVAAQVAPRTAHVKIRRTANLDADARAFEQNAKLGYDAVAAAIDANVGQPLVVEGEVLESRVLNHQTVAVVDDKRGCAKRPCIVRVAYGAEADLHAHDAIRAYGRVARAIVHDGKSIPELDTEILVPAQKKKR